MCNQQMANRSRMAFSLGATLWFDRLTWCPKSKPKKRDNTSLMKWLQVSVCWNGPFGGHVCTAHRPGDLGRPGLRKLRKLRMCNTSCGRSEGSMSRTGKELMRLRFFFSFSRVCFLKDLRNGPQVEELMRRNIPKGPKQTATASLQAGLIGLQSCRNEILEDFIHIKVKTLWEEGFLCCPRVGFERSLQIRTKVNFESVLQLHFPLVRRNIKLRQAKLFNLQSVQPAVCN